MFKVMILLTRKEDLSRSEFKNWWLNEHSILASQLPGLKKACFNLVENEDAPYDGVSELWFDSEDDFTSSYESEIGKSVVADSLAHVNGRTRLIVNENIL
tara:strand:+ start:1498 stop:1797 length:300 start_codon:yes stop_codon:yes gene_type:complete